MLFRISIFLTIIVILNSCSNNKEIKYDTLKNKVDAFQICNEGLEAFNINDYFFASEKIQRGRVIFGLKVCS